MTVKPGDIIALSTQDVVTLWNLNSRFIVAQSCVLVRHKELITSVIMCMKFYKFNI
jgi:hypothetical protein